jgi:hypothetical protein
VYTTLVTLQHNNNLQYYLNSKEEKMNMRDIEIISSKEERNNMIDEDVVHTQSLQFRSNLSYTLLVDNDFIMYC